MVSRTLFYVGGVLVSGLLVPADDDRLVIGDQNHKTGRSSPFVIAFNIAGWAVVRPCFAFTYLILNATAVLSVASRRGECSNPAVSVVGCSVGHLHQQPLPVLPRATRARSELPCALVQVPPCARRALDAERQRLGGRRWLGLGLGCGQRHRCVLIPLTFIGSIYTLSGGSPTDYAANNRREEPALSDADLAGEQVLPSNQPTYVMPLASVLVSASVGLLTFLSYGTGSANTVFNWLGNVASVASLQSWAGMLFTYIRWHQGTVHYERKWKGDELLEGREARAQIAKIKKNRSWGQPYVRPRVLRPSAVSAPDC